MDVNGQPWPCCTVSRLTVSWLGSIEEDPDLQLIDEAVALHEEDGEGLVAAEVFIGEFLESLILDVDDLFEVGFQLLGVGLFDLFFLDG